jgi:hypothetical protein
LRARLRFLKAARASTRLRKMCLKPRSMNRGKGHESTPGRYRSNRGRSSRTRNRTACCIVVDPAIRGIHHWEILKEEAPNMIHKPKHTLLCRSKCPECVDAIFWHFYRVTVNSRSLSIPWGSTGSNDLPYFNYRGVRPVQ